MKESDKRGCVINVFVNEPGTSAIDLVLIITNGFLEEVEITNNSTILYSGFVDTRMHVHFFYTEKTSFTFKIKSYNSKSWNAFQGYVTFDYQEEPCPFSHLSPFQFESPSQIMYIRTKYRHFCPTKIRKQQCSWIFSSGLNGYGFKVLLIEFDAKNTDLLITNSSKYIITDGHHTQSNQVFYNSDDFLKIWYNGTCNDSLDEFLMEAQISVIKNKFEKVSAKCTLSNLEEIPINATRKWTNLKENEEVGYSENAKCEINILMKPKTQLVATVTKLRIETYVDTLKFHEQYYPWRTKSIIFDANCHVFEFPENFENGIVKWEFDSDGSVQSKGFEVIFETFDCKCSCENITVPCDENAMEHHIMDAKYRRVCGHLKCNFTIFENPLCPEKQIQIGLYRPLESAYCLKFAIFSNDMLYLDGRNFKMNAKVKILLPKNQTNILRFSSGNVTEDSDFYFTLASIPTPSHQTIKLTAIHPTYSLEFANFPENTFLTVELNEELIRENDMLEMYANCETSELLTNCFLYKDKTLQKIVSNVEDLYLGIDSKYAINYTSPINSITIYKPLNSTKDYSAVFFRAVNAHTVNCIYKKTVYIIGSTRDVTKHDLITAVSGNANQYCEMVILNQALSQKGIHQFWISNFEEDTILFDGLQNRTKAFTLNKENISLLNQIILGSLFYTIKIPPKTSLIITQWDIYNSPPCTFTSKPFFSFIDTPNFGISSTHSHRHRQIGEYIIEEDTTVTFKLSMFDLSDYGSVTLMNSNNETFRLSKSTPLRSFSNTTVTVFFHEPSLTFKGARILMTNNPLLFSNMF